MEYVYRKATYKDIDDVTVLLKEMFETSLSAYGLAYDETNLSAFIPALIPESFVVETDGKVIGVLAGQITRNPASKDLMYNESFWFVDKSHRGIGLKLLTFVEDYCRSVDVKFFIMAHMGNRSTSLEAIYKRAGYDLLEVHYIKEL